MNVPRRLIGDRLYRAWSLLARIPGLVVSGRHWPVALRQRRATWTARRRRPGQIRLVRLLPWISLYRFQRRRRIHDMVHPAVPARRNQRGLGDPFIDHPAAVETKRRIDFAVPGSVVTIAEFVFTNELAIEPSPQLRSEGLTVPPSEQTKQEGFHGGPAPSCPSRRVEYRQYKARNRIGNRSDRTVIAS